MMSGGSQQLRMYRRARRDGTTMATACVLSGISLAEARLHDAADAENPPPPEAYELLTPSDAQPARLAGTPEKEIPMARADRDQEVQAPDFDKMKRIFTHDIRPATETNSKTRGDLSAAWKVLEDECHLNKRAAKLLYRLSGESEEMRDDFLRTLYGGMKVLGIGISQDLVDRMEGGESPTMPVTAVGGARESALLN